MIKLGSVSVPGQDKNGEVKPNQDYAEDYHDGDISIIVVCDGAGSKTFGSAGSKYLCRVLVRHLLKNTPQDYSNFQETINGAINRFRSVIKRLCRQKNLEVVLEEFASTMMVCFCKTSPDGVKNYCAHLGDGAIFYIDSTFENAVFVSLPENGEYANETYFATDQNWREHLRMYNPPNGPLNIILMTDGVTPMALKRNEPFFDFVRPIMAYINNSSDEKVRPSLSKMLSSEASMIISSDDKSIGWLIN